MAAVDDIRASSDTLFKTAVPRRRGTWGQTIRWGLLFLGGVLMVMPIIYMLSTSMKWPHEIYNVSLFPAEPHLENYTYVLQDGRFYGWFVNSLIIATITTISAVLFDSLVGYTLCKFRFPGRYIVFIAILSTLMIPTEMLVIPWYLMSQQFGWLDTTWGIMFPGLMTAFGTFLMKQFFETIPKDLDEAALIDGCSYFKMFWKIFLPISKPALAAVAIYTFQGSWNEFLWPVIVTVSEDMYTLPLGMASLRSELLTDWPLLMAGTILISLPTLAIFIYFQKYFVQGVASSGLKG